MNSDCEAGLTARSVESTRYLCTVTLVRKRSVLQRYEKLVGARWRDSLSVMSTKFKGSLEREL